MNTRRILSQTALITGTLLFSAGIQTFAAFTQPTTSPPNSDTYAPISTGPTAQSKSGGLLLNTGGATNGLIVQAGNVGIGTTAPNNKLEVAGTIHSTTGGIKFPDGTIQTTSASASGSASHGKQMFTSSGTFVVPAGITSVWVSLSGGGGGGGASTGGNPAVGAGGGGGAHAYMSNVINGLTPGETIIITVGVGGIGAQNSWGIGGAGGTTCFGGTSGCGGSPYLSAAGGGGGFYGVSGYNVYGMGGSRGGSGGSVGMGGTPNMGGAGGGSIFGSGGGYCGSYDGQGCVSPAGGGYGAGGAGGGINGAGGNGSSGFVLVEW